jgi:hypothetical protein
MKAAGSLIGQPRELRDTCPEYMAVDAKKKAAAWGNTAALGTSPMPPDLRGNGDGESSGSKLMRTP